ncbi:MULTISPECIES: helix-turn-helix domain-containing protein [Flavobacterium]|uniref:Transcriptional regulator, AraC family n=1 Tax=Flavobacterium aquidurense TaxID=362413 RepID=A0A0Q0XUC4_9FLAO|nr:MULTISPECIES: helix-turn-helix domain-containing protein [Flavobacterium]KQB39834.1 Transcriptional regulator, AraC family [Flavobacterium aquidurense]OMQ11513.1 AraC family transcriptional regulator [[Flexibacter] sp. ATCC 35103]
MIQYFISNKLESENENKTGLFVSFIKQIKGWNTDKSFKTANFTILLIRSGSIEFEMNDRIQEFTAQELVLVPKDTNYRVISIDEQFQACIMAFSWEYVVKEHLIVHQELFFHFLNSVNYSSVSLDTADFKLMLSLFKVIYLKNKTAVHPVNNGESTHHTITLFLHEIRILYTKYQKSDIIFSRTRKGLLVSQFLSQINIHCKEQHSVEFFANALCVTPAHLNKIVKKITHRNAKDLISEALITKAKELLENPEITIVDIADELEFSNASSFSTFFKKRTALSPSEYRSKIK